MATLKINNLNKEKMKTIYLNLKTNFGIETVDSLNEKEFCTYKEFRKEVQRLKNEYHLAGMNVYTSQRSTKK